MKDHYLIDNTIGGSLNVLAYIIYVPFTLVITFWVGISLHKNGRVYLQFLFKKDLETIMATNDILLIAYYLLNLGYSLVIIYSWEKIYFLSDLLESLSLHTAIILLTLSCIHFLNLLLFNILLIMMASKDKHQDSS